MGAAEAGRTCSCAAAPEPGEGAPDEDLWHPTTEADKTTQAVAIP
jgi:hypothetical protein